jgi:hypothetical protein
MRRRHSSTVPPRPIVRRKEILPEAVWAVTASSDHCWPACWLTTPYRALERDENTEWNSRSPAWIRFDLGPSAPCVSRIELLPSLADEAGYAECRVQLGMHVAEMETVMVMRGSCGHRKWFDCTLNQSRRARFVEIHTDNAPQWTGWIRVRLWAEC